MWPDPRITDRLKRRADALAAAEVQTVLHFGFHERFDLAPYFGLIHGLFADIAGALHERGILFIDHYSCNIVARPRGDEELRKYHTDNRHHVSLHPGPRDAASWGYDGFRFDDLRAIDIGTGEAAYTPYQSEAFCHNNPDFLRMHEGYLRRQLEEIPLDGVMADDMCDYSYFRACGCRHCRERFRRESGHELPPLSDAGFWGDTSAHPSRWGNYDNPAFRDWVLLKYRTTADHLAMVKRTIGPDKILLTCCSSSGPRILNSLGLSYESFVGACDWVLMENCGLAADTVAWARKEPEALLHKSIAVLKASGGRTPAVAISYFLFPDGAYLGWAMARFWGVSNWASTLLQGPFEDLEAGKEEAELTGPYNRWEKEHGPEGAGDDVLEAAVVFTRATRDNGWADGHGREHWERARDWGAALADRNMGYRFVLGPELESPQALAALGVPLVLDGCACMSDRQADALRAFLAAGGKAVVSPPLGSHDERGFARAAPLHEELRGGREPTRALVLVRDGEGAAEVLERLVSSSVLVPRVRVIAGPENWAVRIRVNDDRLVIHLLNRGLQGTEHPDIRGRPSTSRVLHRIVGAESTEPLELLVEHPLALWRSATLASPELPGRRDVRVTRSGSAPGAVRLSIDLRGIRIYAMIRGEAV